MMWLAWIGLFIYCCGMAVALFAVMASRADLDELAARNAIAPTSFWEEICYIVFWPASFGVTAYAMHLEKKMEAEAEQLPIRRIAMILEGELRKAVSQYAVLKEVNGELEFVEANEPCLEREDADKQQHELRQADPSGIYKVVKITTIMDELEDNPYAAETQVEAN